MDADPIPVAVRHRQYRNFGVVRLFGPCPVSKLRGPAGEPDGRAAGPDAGWADYVGAGFGHLPRAHVCDRDESAFAAAGPKDGGACDSAREVCPCAVAGALASADVETRGAGHDAGSRGWSDGGRFSRAAGDAPESGRRASLDSLACAVDHCTAGAWEPV